MPRIELLPPELLHIIFTFVHSDFKLTTAAFEHGLYQPEIDISQGFDDGQGYEMEVAQFLVEQTTQITSSNSASLFPYSLAAVCNTWKNILSGSPVFWTHVVLFVDSPPTPMDDARQYLQWSRQLPIDVFLLRASESDFQINDMFHSLPEQQHVADFIGLLRPHMRRCRSLHIDANVNSSLPHLSDIVPSHAPLLRSLSLTCEFDYMLKATASERFLSHIYFFLPDTSRYALKDRHEAEVKNPKTTRGMYFPHSFSAVTGNSAGKMDRPLTIEWRVRNGR